MAYFQFLGSGPMGANAEGIGRNFRRPASALLNHISTYLLFDTTATVTEQCDQALSVTHVVWTGFARDHIRGLPDLERWLEMPATALAPQSRIDALRKVGTFRKLQFEVLRPLVPTTVSDIVLTAFPLVGAGGEALLGYHIDTSKKRITCAPCFVSIPQESQAFFASNDLLVVDGGGWLHDTPQHAGALNQLPVWLEKANETVIFTGIPVDAPPHTQAVAAVRRVSHRADIAYDFMKFPLGR